MIDESRGPFITRFLAWEVTAGADSERLVTVSSTLVLNFSTFAPSEKKKKGPRRHLTYSWGGRLDGHLAVGLCMWGMFVHDSFF